MAVSPTAIILAGCSIVMERGRQQSGSLVNGCPHATKASSVCSISSSNSQSSVFLGRRRGCHFDGTPSPSLLRYLLKGGGGMQQNDSLLQSGVFVVSQ